MSLVTGSSQQTVGFPQAAFQQDTLKESSSKRSPSKKRVVSLTSGVAALVLAVSFSGIGEKPQLTSASAQTGPMSKMTSELSGQNRRARMITANELETLLPSARRYELVEEAKRVLYPGLDFSTDIEPKKALK